MKWFINFLFASLHRHPLWIIGTVSAVAIVFVLYNFTILAEQINKETTQQHAACFVESLDITRKFYSSDITSRVPLDEVTVSHDYLDHENSIPNPATFTIKLGDIISSKTDISARLYSDYPFPGRENGGLKDRFEGEAIGFFRSGQGNTFWNIENVNGIASLRFAKAIRGISSDYVSNYCPAIFLKIARLFPCGIHDISMDTTESSKYILGQITVRVLEDNERPRFDELLEQRHYLKSARVGGRSLRYVAELNGDWIALICFSGAAPHLAGREQWIGWSPTQRARRLCFVVNNSRYLLLPDRHVYPNLGSKVLSLCLKRLCADWEQLWGQPVLVVESFVDEGLGYEGTCYKACGFEAVGPSAGYSRSSRDYYIKHDRAKQLYLRSLDQRARQWLSGARLPAALAGHELDRAGPCPFKAEALGSLLELFKSFKDSRRGHGLLHRQCFVLACATVTMLMGADSYQAMEDLCGKLDQRQLRALGARKNTHTGRYRAPSDSTFFRVLGMVDTAAFDALVGQWMSLREPGALERIAVDGKTLRGSKRGEEGKALQLLSAVTHRLRLTIAQREIEEKSNEIPALEPMLESIPIMEGSLVTADAMQCQQQACAYITQQRGADYLIGLKGNQSGILERAKIKLPQEFFSLRT